MASCRCRCSEASAHICFISHNPIVFSAHTAPMFVWQNNLYLCFKEVSKAIDLFLHHGFLILCLYHIQLCLLGIQLSLSLLKVHISYCQTILLHCQVSLKKKGRKRERETEGSVIAHKMLTGVTVSFLGRGLTRREGQRKILKRRQTR